MIWFGLAFAVVLLFAIKLLTEKQIFETFMTLTFGSFLALGCAYLINVILSNWVPTTTTTGPPIPIVEFSVDGKDLYVGSAVVEDDSSDEPVHYWYVEKPDGVEWAYAEKGLVNRYETDKPAYIEYVYVDSDWQWLTVIGDTQSGDIVNVYAPQK